MVLSAPRSASTWVANWLTTERTLCLHDPILEHTPELMDDLSCDRMLGISCTGLALLPAFVNAHPARKVIVHRSLVEVNRSLETLGLTRLGMPWVDALDRLHGLHVMHHELFDPGIAGGVYERLTGLTFDVSRHKLLTGMHVEPVFDTVKVVPDRARAFRDRIQRALA
jgi:hypothetical protein